MTEEDPDLLAGDNLDKLRGRNPYPAMSERYRLTEELENARYQNNLLTDKCRQLELENARYQNNLLIEKCRQIEMERDEARRFYCEMLDGYDGITCKEWAKRYGWDCFKET
jgi:hypothetical protein